MRVSLKELLLILTVASVGMASCFFASGVVASAWRVAMFCWASMLLVRCLFAVGGTRAFSLGALCVSVLYLALVLYVDEDEASTDGGKLLTTQAKNLAYEAVLKHRDRWIDEQGNRLNGPPQATIIGMEGGWYMAESGERYRFVRVHARSLTVVAHCLWTLLFGYLGGKYAVWVYGRREGGEH